MVNLKITNIKYTSSCFCNYENTKFIHVGPFCSISISCSSEEESNYYKNYDGEVFKVEEVSRDEVEKSKTLEDLTEKDLKDILREEGITTNLRSKYKLIELINDNVSDISKYL